MKIGTVSTYAKKTLLLLVLLGFCARSYAATAGSITLSGTEQFNSSNSMWDSGNVTVSINGYVKTVPYGQFSTPDSIASAIAALFTSDCNGPANARSAPGGVIYVQMRDGATLSELTANTYSSVSFAAAVNSSLIQTTTTATIASTQLLLGQTTTVNVQVSCDSACGSVDYRIDGGEWGTVALDANGQFSATTSSGWAPGLHNVVIRYQGSGTYAVSTSNPVSFMISSSSTSQPPTSLYSYNITTYQANGNVSAYTDSVNGTWSNIQYDGVNRLAAATQAVNGNTQYMCWGYDSFGNRTAQMVSGSQCSAPVPTATYNANNQDTALQYDESGDVINDGQHQYLYDAEGRVCAVQYQVLTGGPVSMMGYLYDAEGRRVAKGTISSFSCDMTPNPNTGLPNNGFTETAGYVLGPGGEQLTEVDGGGTPQHTNVFAAGSLIATYDPDGLHFHLNDWLGTRRVDTDYLGNAQSTYHSLPYGEMVPSTQSISTTEHFFTGKERDAESGNDYFGARYYSSAMGRFLSPDWSVKTEPVPYAKLDNPQSLNLYSYVGNDPLVAVDPDGHLPKWLTNLNWSSGGMSLEDLLLYIGIGPRGRNAQQQKQNALDKVAVKAETSALEKTIASQKDGHVNEYGGRLLRRNSDGQYSYTKPIKGGEGEVDLSGVRVPKGYTAVGTYHTHPGFPGDIPGPSPHDVNILRNSSTVGYVTDPVTRTVFRYTGQDHFIPQDDFKNYGVPVGTIP